MISLLARLLIKDNKNYKDLKVRERYGILCGGFGVFLNVVLFFLKFIFGTIAASVSMVADAFNNLSDAASSLISLIGFKLSSKKPDSKHPFGYGRIEYICGFIISCLIILMGFELLKSSIDSLIHPSQLKTNIFSVIVMAFSIVIKIYMYFYNHLTAKKIDSVSLEATAKDSLGDVISTSVVIGCLILSKFVSWPVDGIAGIIVALFIFKTGFESSVETVRPLLGTACSKELSVEIANELLAHKGIVGIHDLVVHDYGPGRKMISLHAEVPGEVNIFELHDLIDNAEVDIAKKFNCSVTIHMDPIDTKNKQLDEYKKIALTQIKQIYSELTMHDFRMVPGPTHTNLIFDVVKPFKLDLTDDELKHKIQESICNCISNINCVITIDKPYIDNCSE